MGVIEAILLAIVEGITEFLPISSTGHMIIASSMMGIAASPFVKMFTVAIQFGAILSVMVLYWKRFLQSFDFYFKLLVAFLPAAVLGFLLNDFIDALLENVVVVGLTLFLGGFVLLFIDKWLKNEKDAEDSITYPKALKIGFFQVIAMIPGVSRSAATIIGGLQQKLTRKAAAEFSYKMLKYHKEVGFVASDAMVLLLGNIVAFVVALIAIKGFIAYLTKHGFRIFGWYRIVVGAIIIGCYLMGFPLQIL
jgi:undecaprenyl-diphosphatase